MLISHLARSLLRSRAALAAENLALRQQLIVLQRTTARPRIRTRDRLFWVLLRRLWSGWRDALLIVRPATVVAWHRAGWRLVWRRKSRGRSGRPPIPHETRELIRRLSRANRFWGAPRIQAELAHLGVTVATSTVEKYMVRRVGPPSPTWRAFLSNHATEILACDFFTVTTVGFKTLTGFVVMELGRRRILAVGVTSSPTAEWAAAVVKRAFEAGGGCARFLLRDRDGIYGEAFKAVVRSLGIRQVVTAYRAPLMNAHAERLIGSIRRECLDHVIVWNERHANRLLEEYAEYYNGGRCHQALDGDTPRPRTRASPGAGELVATPVLGGLHHTYRRAA